MIEIFMRIIDVLLFFSILHSFIIFRYSRLRASTIVWREDYFLTKLKTYPHTMCHVPLWSFKIGMFNKLSRISLVSSSIVYDFYGSRYYFLCFFLLHMLSSVINLPTILCVLKYLFAAQSCVIFFIHL